MLLNERVIAEAKIVESDHTKLPDGVLVRVRYPTCNIGKLNANKRRYGLNVWERVGSDKDINEKMAKRALFGHAEHPASSQSDLQLTSHVIFEMTIDGDTVYHTFDVLDTPGGRIVDTLLRAKCQVGCSTRAEGELSEAVDDDGNKCYDVIAESYKFITVDFTADPSTFGSVPIEVKRNMVSKVRNESINEKATADERKFATTLLESMKCKHEAGHKCQGCGACGERKMKYEKIGTIGKEHVGKKLEEAFPVFKGNDTATTTGNYVIQDKDIGKFIVKTEQGVGVVLPDQFNEKKVDEGIVTIAATPDANTVTVNGAVNNVNVNPDSAAGNTVSVTINTVPPPPVATPDGMPVMDSEPKPEMSPEAAKDFEEGLKKAIDNKKSEAEEESETPEEEEKEHEDEEEDEEVEESKVNEAVPDVAGDVTTEMKPGSLVVDKDGENWVVQSMGNKTITLKPAGGGVGTVKVLRGDEITAAELTVVNESKVNEVKGTGVKTFLVKHEGVSIAVLKFKHFGSLTAKDVKAMLVDRGEYGSDIEVVEEEPRRSKTEERDDLEAQWAQSPATDVPNESVAVNVNDLRIKEAVSRAKLARAFELLESLANKDLEAKIAVRKLKEMVGSENSEVEALRAKLEEKAKFAATTFNQLTEATTTIGKKDEEIKALTEKVAAIEPLKESHTKEIDALKAERAAEVEASKVQNEKLITEKVTAAVTDATAKLIKEYAARQISGFTAVQANVRALLERCTSFAEVDKAVEDYRDSRRQSALHSKPLKEVIVQKEEPRDPAMENARTIMGKVFEGFGM
jgi:hypothetical protein